MWPGECNCDCHVQFNGPHEECTPRCRHEGVPECKCPLPGNLNGESSITSAKKCFEAKGKVR